MTTPSPIDYLALAQQCLDNQNYGRDTRYRFAESIATIGILQQLTRIADMLEADRKPRPFLREYG